MTPGPPVGPFDTTMDRRYIARYAAATADDLELHEKGSVTPPLALAGRIFEAQMAAMSALIPSTDIERRSLASCRIPLRSERQAGGVGGLEGQRPTVDPQREHPTPPEPPILR